MPKPPQPDGEIKFCSTLLGISSSAVSVVFGGASKESVFICSCFSKVFCPKAFLFISKHVIVAISVNMTDVHNLRDFSGNVAISRQIFTGSSISVGAMQIFANRHQSDAPVGTFYFAFSHAIQTLKSRTNGSSKLVYTLGIGNGRFYVKSPYDINAGRGRHGTAVFGSISYELAKNINVNAEWSGMNLGCSLGVKPFESPLAIGIGLTDLTRYSSDKINSTFVISYPLSVKR